MNVSFLARAIRHKSINITVAEGLAPASKGVGTAIAKVPFIDQFRTEAEGIGGVNIVGEVYGR